MIIHNVKINFFDCDPAGILFYGRIFQICHSAYEMMIESFNLDVDYWVNNDFVVPIISSEARYTKPVKYGENISIELSVSQIKHTSFELEFKCKKVNGDICIDVRTVHVFVDKKSWKKKDINKNIREGLQKHLSRF